MISRRLAALVHVCLLTSTLSGAGCGASGAASLGGGSSAGAGGAAASAPAAQQETSSPQAGAATGGGAAGTATGKTVPTEESPLPTGAVSTVEIPTPGVDNKPGGGSSAADQVNPLCRDVVAGKQSCVGISADYDKLHQDYCTFIKNPGKGSEGEDLVYDPEKRAALNKLAATTSACCKNDVGDGTRC